MSDDPTTEPVNDSADTGGTAGSNTTAPSTTTDKAPKWEGDFDPDKAARLVANLREELAGVKSKLKTREDAEKNDLQKATERGESLAHELNELRRKDAARDYGIPASLAKFIIGDSPDEITASAKALADELGAVKPDTDSLPGRPKPRLKPGHGTGDDASGFDPVAVAKAARGY
ncbi:hypothetical protein [Krasilnikovia sp. MM14-A1259]|uniref:hypothetical protein n=1 Tax=Krasilnikovia sp. MM14-A1259 TaxID=3373539 RepID=UPI00382D2F00